VYWGNGCQIIPPHDEGIAATIAQHTALWPEVTPRLVAAIHRDLTSDHPCSQGLTAMETPADPTAKSAAAATGTDPDVAGTSIFTEAEEAALAQVCDPSAKVVRAYMSRLLSAVCRGEPSENAAAQPVTYTPLHGVGAAPLLAAFAAAGLPPPILVASQVRGKGRARVRARVSGRRPAPAWASRRPSRRPAWVFCSSSW
jgi:phosphomannomutase